MAPKRSAVRLRALADDPGAGWLQTPVASHSGQGFLAGPYLAAFMKHHDMPVTSKAMERMSGTRLWLSHQTHVPVEQRSASKLSSGGIEALARAFNHGFSAPVDAQDQLIAFLRYLPVEQYGEAAARMQLHYELCRAFRLRETDLASPPSYLDLFKDDRVSKAWRADSAFQSVLISANGLLHTWTDLMAPGWNPHNASRDAASCWESCRGDVETLHLDLENEGRCLSLPGHLVSILIPSALA